MNSFRRKAIFYILSIETTVAGGNLSLLLNGQEIDSWSGSREVSKAEDVLEQISNILESNNVKKSQLHAVVVSEEDNSTGGKIGSAIAKGLVKSLNCQLVQTSVLKSQLSEFTDADADADVYLSAAPVGKNQMKWQCFRKKGDFAFQTVSSLQIAPASRFVKELQKFAGRKTVVIADFGEVGTKELAHSFARNDIPVFFTKQNLAKLNAIAAINNKCIKEIV